MRRLAHIVNPVRVGASSDLFKAQPVTFASMETARRLAQGMVQVELYAAQFAEDRGLVPPFIQETPDLVRSVLDVGSFRVPRKLPLIRDILDRLAAATEADYLLYTNVDIGLLPHFYLVVDMLIEQGCEAMIINRRTIAKDPSEPALLPLMWSQVGDPHPGRDCFVFPRRACDAFEVGDTCIGASSVGKVLALNLACQVPSFREFTELHVTFHLGDDRSWLNPEAQDYEEHNRRQLARAVETLRDRGELVDHPLVNRLAGLVTMPEAGAVRGDGRARSTLRQRLGWGRRVPRSS